MVSFERRDSVNDLLIDDLLDRIATGDGVAPFDEQARLNLSKPGSLYSVACDDGRPVGIAAADIRTRSVHLAVDATARRQGIGSHLLADTRAQLPNDGADWSIWAHGSLPGAQGLARKAGLEPIRELLVMTRDLADVGDGAEWDDPSLALTTFELDRDLADLTDLNARAFAYHPEQGTLSDDDFRERMNQPWFDPTLLWIVRDGSTPVAFLWLKPQSESQIELYVLGVDPDMQGRGLGRRLSRFMLGQMVERGYRDAILYVEADNEPAVRAYRGVGFAVAERHAAYRL